MDGQEYAFSVDDLNETGSLTYSNQRDDRVRPWYTTSAAKAFLGVVFLFVLLACIFASVSGSVFWYEYVHGGVRDDDDNWNGIDLTDVHIRDDDDTTDPPSSIAIRAQLNVTDTARFSGDVDMRQNKEGLVDGIPRFTREYNVCAGHAAISRGESVGWYAPPNAIDSVCATSGFKDTASIFLDTDIDAPEPLELISRNDGSRDLVAIYLCQDGRICWKHIRYTGSTNDAQAY
ncbi:hypothetical protein KDA14_01725, partial [Candidatus Saccharibacteria bacterium]|nr:hypothetical protein [Candidatus Saccharibacteria bacterium]